MRNVSDKQCRENQNTHFIFNKFFSNRAVSELMQRHTVDSCEPQMTVRHICTSRHVPIVTNTHSEYAFLIAFPLQQLLQERTSMLCYAYISSLVYHSICPESLSFQVIFSDNTLNTGSDKGRMEPVLACDERGLDGQDM